MAAVCSILAAPARLCVIACLFFFLAQRGTDRTWKKDPKCAVILTSENQQRGTTPRRSTNAAGLARIYIYTSSQCVIHGRTPRVASVFLQAAPSPS